MTLANATRRACRRPWTWVAVVLLLALQPAAGEGLFFQATRPGAAPVFLVGTMHSDDPRVMALLPGIVELIGQVDTVALEMIQDPDTMARAATATLLPAGQDLFEQVGPARRDRLERAAAQRGIPVPLLARLKPWAAALVLGLPELSSGQVLDSAIQREAARLGRALVGLEQSDDQLALFEAMEEPLQLALLDSAIKNTADLTTQFEELTRAYLAGDLGGLEQAALGRYGDLDPAVEHWFRDRLIERRNREMAQRVRELARQGPLLVAVGALHLVGDSGLVAALERAGYRVGPVPTEPGPTL